MWRDCLLVTPYQLRLLALGKTIAAKNRSAGARNKRNRVLLSTLAANDRSFNTLCLSLGFALGAAIGTTLGSVFESTRLVKFLLGSGECKLGTAVLAS